MASGQVDTVGFNTPTELAPFTVQTSDGALNFGADAGTGAPAGGGLIFAGITSGTEHSAVVYRKDAYSATNGGTFRASIYVNFKDFLRADGTKDKGEIRIGFVTDTTINSSSPHEFFNKTNPGFSLRLSAEHQQGVTDRKIEAELTSFTTSEGKYQKKAVTASSAFTNWLKVTFTAVRTGTSTFDLSYTVEDCGIDGLSQPAVIAGLTGGPQSVTHAAFGSDATVYGGFLVRPDKFSTTTTYLDNHTVEVIASAPAAPLASAATQVASTSFTANWQAGSGVAAESYILEVSTAADNFAPNTFIGSTGAGGQSAGILVGGANDSATLTNLQPGTAYVYRVRGMNGIGTSGASNVITVTTLQANVNSAPTLDPIEAQIPIRPTDPARTITLTGITAGGETSQTISVTAVSSAPTIIPHPTINYISPASSATLTYDPAGTESGDVTITVTVNDGQASNNTITRSFTVAVKNPQPLIGFDSAAELIDLDHEPINGTLTRMDEVGTGTPASGGLVFQGTAIGSDRGAAVWRIQPYSGITSTNLRASIFFNAREVDNQAVKDKGELQIGFVGTTNVNTAKPQEFLQKSNPGMSVKLKVEHDSTEPSKNRQIEAEAGSFDGFTEIKGEKKTLINSPSIDHWLKVVFDAVRTGEETYRITYRIEDWGMDGTALVGVLIESAPIDVTNATIATDPQIWAAFSVSTEKNGVAEVYMDRFEAEAGENPPIEPVAGSPVQVTSNSFVATWQPGAGVFSTDWVLEVSTAANNFAPGTLLGANGATGQASGITVAGGTTLKQRVSGLGVSSQYVYRVRGTNAHGTSGVSNTVTVTTLASGQNSAPTLDPIANPPALNINSSQQSILLTGISAGGEPDQFATISAVSSNPSLIPDPSIDYSDPEETGTLFFTPNEGQTGTATITVTVDDGEAANNTVSRTFTVTVTEPQTLIGFNDLTAFERLAVSNFNGADVTFGATAGTGSPASGGAVFSRSGSLESVAVGFRQTAYDARVAPFLTASIMVNLREIVGITTGKDKAELRLAFAGSNLPNTLSPKDSLSKTSPALGLTLKVEHQVGAADKDRKVEVELYSYNGANESKGSKQSALRVDATSNWLQVNLYIVRAGQDQYYLVYGLEDYGPNGTAWQGQVLTGGPFLVTNSPFFNDETVYAGFSLAPEKTSVANIYLDNYEVIVNTTAPDAPLPLAAGNVRAKQFTANWAPSAIGFIPDSYLLEVSTQADNFAPGTLISASGAGQQSAGIVINNSSTTSLTITGLNPGEDYVYRIRAKRNGEFSAIAGKTFVTTLSADLAYWREIYFPGQLNDPAVSGLGADGDHDRISNLMEYALGLDPTKSDVQGLPAVEVYGDYLRLTYKRRRNAPDVVYVPEVTDNLDDSWSMNVTEVYVSAPDEFGMETVVVEDIVPISSASARFMRLRVLTLE